MRCPTLVELPPPPPDKTGWPWTEESQRLPQTTPSGAPWPRISIVTPSLDQGEFIEETIRSVLLQGYPNLEYMVIDGGSNDNTIDVLKRYDPFLTKWVSEPDRGQAHAINKGMAHGSGEILAYLNSDDFYLPGSLRAVGERFVTDREGDLFHGGCQIVGPDGQSMREQWGRISTIEEILDLWNVWWNQRYFVQPEVFWTRRIADKVGPFRDDLHFVIDYDYWVRILDAGGKVRRLDRHLAAFRITPKQKIKQSDRLTEEHLDVLKNYLWNHNLGISKSTRWRLRKRKHGVHNFRLN